MNELGLFIRDPGPLRSAFHVVVVVVVVVVGVLQYIMLLTATSTDVLQKNTHCLGNSAHNKKSTQLEKMADPGASWFF